ncbi:MAG: hypothetical protein H6732_13865 [Alphaproteobacteria bacterium]|nr:hypothetical protein [Alphaproteobacteria bacterium]
MAHSLTDLLDLPDDELNAMAARLGIATQRIPWRDGLAAAIADRDGEDRVGCGVLEVHSEGFGFLRSLYDDLLPGSADIYVSQSQIKRFELRTGDTVIGRIRPPKEQERYAALLRVETINGDRPDVHVTPFAERDAAYPTTRLPLLRDPWLAAVDWVAPLGLGSRGLIVAPSRSERAELLRRVAQLFVDDDRFEVTVLLPGERPEDVSEWREGGRLQVVATPVDEAPAKHLHVADVAFERARRLAERGAEVLLLVDSFTRLLRFALADASPGGHTVDGLDANALLKLRRWLSTGRDLVGAGSVTLLATVDDDPGDALSAALLRDLTDVATWRLQLRGGVPGTGERPDLRVAGSWTRREDRLLELDELTARRRWRAALADDPVTEADALASLFRPAAVAPGKS